MCFPINLRLLLCLQIREYIKRLPAEKQVAVNRDLEVCEHIWYSEHDHHSDLTDHQDHHRHEGHQATRKVRQEGKSQHNTDSVKRKKEKINYIRICEQKNA